MRQLRFGAILGSACLTALCAGGTALAAETGRTLGFAVTNFDFAIDRDRANCPNGFTPAAKDLYLHSVSPAERLRLLKPENLKEFEKKAYHTPDGTDLCHAPDYPRPPQYQPVGKKAPGMSLDGTTDGHATDTTCAHEKFTAPDGTLVDNQMFRMVGCASNYVGFYDGEIGYLESLRNQSFKDGGNTFLFEVTGVDDSRNDAEVQIGVYNSPDPMALNAQGKMVPYASLSVLDEKKFQAVVKGKIVEGVVLSDVLPTLNLKYIVAAAPKEYNLTDARIRIEIGKDGQANGMVAGYLVQGGSAIGPDGKSGLQLLTEMVGLDCPSWIQAAAKLADGHKDPVTGKCTGFSTAWEMKLVSAFVIHPEQVQKSASAQPAQEQAAERR